SAQIREILISESAWEEMTCLFAPSLATYGYRGESFEHWCYQSASNNSPINYIAIAHHLPGCL
ncbi:hypothetical protein P0228_21080, partial [Escherichia coli]